MEREEERRQQKGDAEKTRNGPFAKQRQVAVSKSGPTVGWRSEKGVEGCQVIRPTPTLQRGPATSLTASRWRNLRRTALYGIRNGCSARRGVVHAGELIRLPRRSWSDKTRRLVADGRIAACPRGVLSDLRALAHTLCIHLYRRVRSDGSLITERSPRLSGTLLLRHVAIAAAVN